MSLFGRVVLLMLLWLLAWGEITLANVLTGAAVIAALLVAFPPAATTRVRLHPPAVARLVGYVVVQLVSSNILMARQILRLHPAMRPGVLAHPLERPSDHVVTLMTSIIALSPGTMTVDVDPRSTTIYVHFLFLDDVDAARVGLERLERLVSQALSVSTHPAHASHRSQP